jgi:hypothetical protein
MRPTLPKQLLVLVAITILIFSLNLFFVTPASIDTRKLTDVSTCRNCHQAIVDSFIKTAHYYDSRPADSKSIKGSFEEGKNIYEYNDFMKVEMVTDGNQYWQLARVNGTPTASAPFDIVIGSGRNGQTYLTWVDNKLYQLPISYYAPSNQWCNSPGFPKYFFFDRQIPANCLECHATSTKVISYETMEYDKSSIVYGITCERCHPGAAEHAAYQTSHPAEKQAKYVVNSAHLSRQLRMDACGLCHSGFRTAVQPPFSFRVGDSLDKFSIGGPVSTQPDTLDVHGNQYGLLTASKCYIKSTTMNCSTCHDVHNNEFADTKLFTSKCISCHSDAGHTQCSFKTKKNIVMNDNCVNCHMPVLASNAIKVSVKTDDEMLPDFLHTHFISIYKEATENVLKRNKKAAKGR